MRFASESVTMGMQIGGLRDGWWRIDRRPVGNLGNQQREINRESSPENNHNLSYIIYFEHCKLKQFEAIQAM